MTQSDVRLVLEAAYLRLLTRLATRDVSIEQSRLVALDALAQALKQLDVPPDPVWLEEELERLRTAHPIAPPADKHRDQE